MISQSIFQMNRNVLDKPFKELMELHNKTLQSFEYINPNELFSLHNPEQMEKNMDAVIQNAHKTLDYMQTMFHIAEKHWFKMSDKVTENTEAALKQTQKTARHNAKRILNLSEQAVEQTHTASGSQKKKSALSKSSRTKATRVLASSRKATPKSPTATSKKTGRKMASSTSQMLHKKPELKKSESRTHTSH